MSSELLARPDWLPDLANAEPESIAAGWKARLLSGSRGKFLANVANALVALRHAPEWRGVLSFNESTLSVIAKAPPPFELPSPVPFAWADDHDVRTAAWLQYNGIGVSKEIAGQAVQAVARERSFHPIRDYLDSTTWDQISRIDDWLTVYLGADSSEYIRAVGAKWLIGGVARICKPGCKVDTCLILEGEQGLLKSTALRTLAHDEFFTDDIADLGSKDSVLQTRGKWIIELGELDAMCRVETSRVKAFISRQVDHIRPPYGRHAIDLPRECIFAGSTNKTNYLKDETGARRFWPVVCGRIDIDALKRDRDHLWAEAVARFCAGEKWWLDSKTLLESAAEEAQARYEGDPWDEKIAEWIKERQSVRLHDILEQCLGKTAETWRQADQNRVARSLRAKGWKRYQERTGSGPKEREWRYKKSPVL